MHPAAWLVPRAVAQQAGPWNEESLSLCPNDDGEYFCRVVLASKQVKFCPGAKSFYRSGLSASLSGLRSAAAWKSILCSLELCTSHLLAVENSSRTRHACATAFQRFIYSAYPDVPDLVQKAETKVESLGGSDLKPGGGPCFQFLSSLGSWKLAKQLQKLSHLR